MWSSFSTPHPPGPPYNTVVPASGKVLTGGVDANALQKPKRFFGAAAQHRRRWLAHHHRHRPIDTGSRMDDVIYEEFKGTGNMEIHLDRRMAEKRVYPAINVNRSGTRREELLLKSDILQRSGCCKLLRRMDDIDAMEFLLDKIKATKNNSSFLTPCAGLICSRPVALNDKASQIARPLSFYLLPNQFSAS